MEMWTMIFTCLNLLIAALLILFLLILSEGCIFIIRYYWRAHLLRPVMDKQGIPGAPYASPIFDIFENIPDMKEISHDILPFAHPMLSQYLKLYGNVHLNWWLREPRIVITDPNMLWDLFIKNHASFAKSKIMELFSDDIFKGSLFHENGKAWSRQRPTVAPQYYAHNVKGMIQDMVVITKEFMNKWESSVQKESGGEVEVFGEFMHLNVEVVAKTAFGLPKAESNAAGIVQCVNSLIMLQNSQETWSWLPLARMIPFRVNMERRQWRKQLENIIGKQLGAKTRLRKPEHFDVVLRESGASKKTVLANCKMIYATGFASLSPLLSYTMLMLAKYPSWQHKARQEVDEIIKDSESLCDTEFLSKLRTVEMILNETMRLYPTMPLITRVCVKDTMLGNVFIPKGLGISVPVVAIHHDKSLWGEDVNEFNPLRFEHGTAAAGKHPMAFMPFSFGSRTCIGRVYSEIQCKVVIASILQRFEIELSPNYRHHPYLPGPMVPRNGMPVMLKLRNKDML